MLTPPLDCGQYLFFRGRRLHGMTRVLHLISGLTGGGAERQLTLLAAAQAALGHDVHIAMLRPEIPPQLADTNVQIHLLSVSSHFDPRMILQLRSLIKRMRADVVQTWLTFSDAMGGTAAVMTNTPWVLSERSMVEAYPPAWRNTVRTRMGHYAQAIVANSRGGIEYWQSQGIPNERLSEIPNAVDLDSLDGATSNALPPQFDNRRLVLFAGRLADEKNPIVMVDALAMALEGTDAIALLCGTGPLEGDVIARIHERNAQDRIVLAGHRRDVPGLMKRASLCVAISKFEGSPNVALEAMATGCPLVVSDISAYRQLLDADSTLFVPLSDVAAIARAIRSVLDYPAEARKRADHARGRIGDFTPDHVAKAFDAVYRKVVYATR